MPRSFPEIGRHATAEFFLAHSLYGPGPVHVQCVKHMFHHLVRHTALLQFPAYVHGTVTPVDSVVNVGFCVAFVALQTLACQVRHDGFNGAASKTAQGEFSDQFLPAVLPPRQQVECTFPDRLLVVAQASTSSASSLSLAARSGRTRARTAASISCAMSVCSLRKLRTLSFPWPMRSPL